MRFTRRPPLAAGAAIAATVLLALLAALRDAPPQPLPPAAVAAASRIVPIVIEPPRLAVIGPMEEAGPAEPPPAASPAPADVLIQQALQSADPRIRTQAWRLLRHCAFVLPPGSVRPLVAPPPWMDWPLVRRADQAWAAVAARCEGLRGLPDREALERRLDPVPAHERTAAGAPAAEALWLAQAFGRHGGEALLWAGDALEAWLDRRTGEPDGDRLETLDPEAIQIARCHFGEDCGPGSDAAHAACLTLGACEGDLAERLLSTLASRPARERVRRQADALVEALTSGDLARYGLVNRDPTPRSAGD